MAQPPRDIPSESWVQKLHRMAHVDAARFMTHIGSYDLAHDLAYLNGAPSLYQLDVRTLKPQQRAGTEAWLQQLQVRGQEYGDETAGQLPIVSEHTVSLFFALRHERAHDNPDAALPQHARGAAKPKHESRTANLRYTDHQFDQLKHWVAAGPTQEYCVRSWDYPASTTANALHLYSITVPADQSAYLQVFRQRIMEHTGLTPNKHVNSLKDQIDTPTEIHARNRIVFDIARHLERDPQGKIHIQHVAPDNRNETISHFWLTSWKNTPELYPPSPQFTADSPNAETLRLRINPDLTGDGAPASGPRTDSGLRHQYALEQFVKPLERWMKASGAKDFEIGMHEIERAAKGDKHNAFMLRISIDDKDVAAKLCLDNISSTIDAFKLKTYAPPKNGGMTL